MKPVPHGEPYAGKLHVRFDEGAGVPDEGRPALLYTLLAPSGTAEAVIPIGSSLKGAAISASWGAGVGVEGHAITSYTTVQEFDWSGFVEMVKQWWNGK